MIKPGKMLAHYEVIDKIGAGGMGEVWKARDTTLDREVAIKILPELFAQDEDRRARFEREARLLAQLNHPGIAAVHGLHQEDGMYFLAMELVPGEDLYQRLEKGPLPLDDALKVGIRVAEALEAAHEQGVIHRDLKPSNIVLMPGGAAKVLDFGLAKSMDTRTPDSDVSQSPTMQSPTITTPGTMEGVILGTAAYMSPEQARGKPLDRRTDIWAFGCVLYECLTGKSLFRGETVSDTIGAILHKDPDWEALPQGTPPAVALLIKRCLNRDAEQRLRDIGDARIEIGQAMQDPSGSYLGITSGFAAAAPAKKTKSKSLLITALVGVLGLAAGAAVVNILKAPAPKQVIRFHVDPPEDAEAFRDPKISPDGNHIAFLASDSTAVQSIWIRSFNSLDARPIPGTAQAFRPFWSPDSKYLGFFMDGKARKVSASGGPIQTIGDGAGADGTWTPSGIILFDNSATDSVMAINASGGVPYPATVIDRSLGETGTVWPYALPDGKRFLFLAIGDGEATLKLGELGSLESKVIGKIGNRFEYLAPNLLYVREGTLVAQGLDLDKGMFTGEPIPVAENVSAGGANFDGSFSVSNNGIMTYWEGVGSSFMQLVWTDRKGVELEVLGDPAEYDSPSLSPDGTRLLMAINDLRTNTSDLWMRDLTRGTLTRFSFDPARDFDPVWSPDGKRVVFTSDRGGSEDLYVQNSRGGALPDSLYGTRIRERPSDWSPDGEWIIITSLTTLGSGDVLAVPASGQGEPLVIANSRFTERHGKVSPNGRWIAYESLESGSSEIYVQAFPHATGKWQVSIDGGAAPQWSADGKELFYLDPSRILMASEVNIDGEGFQAGIPQALFQTQARGRRSSLNRFLPSPDGKRFLFDATVRQRISKPITVVLNWDLELMER